MGVPEMESSTPTFRPQFAQKCANQNKLAKKKRCKDKNQGK